jgi:multidrug resistance protein MdtO
MTANPASTSLSSWWQKFWKDQQPTPGRLNSTLRIVLASVIALILMLVWQMPFVSIGLYFIFLVARDSPDVSLRSGVISFFVVSAAIAVEFAVVILTDNDPMARLLSVAVVTFLAGVVVVASSLPVLGSTWGLIYCTVISLWETHAPEGSLVKSSLRLAATFSVALGCAVSVEYMFGVRDPVKKLEEQRSIRYQALETMFTLYAQGGPANERFEATARVSRLAVAGQTVMMTLYNAIVDRNLATDTLPIASRTRLTMLAVLMDDAAAFGLQNQAENSPELRKRYALIAEQCRELSADSIPASENRMEARQGETLSLLDRVEGDIHAILTMPSDPGATKNKELAALPSNKVPFFIPGALQRKETVAFGLKISLCATLCYIIYHAVDWPGIATSVITVVVTGLSSSGAIKQRLLFRLVGATIGGLILGLGTTSLLFPYMDSITSLVVLIAVIAFASAWIAAGPKFSYVGLQLALSFYLVAFEGFSAPTELAPGRDRLIGILLALGVMWFVFDQIWPVRTVAVMRQRLASVLRSGAALLHVVGSVPQRAEMLRLTDQLRDRVGKNIADLRSLSDTVEFEFGVDREQHLRTSEMLIRAAVTAAALFWNQVAILHSEQDNDFIVEPDLVAMRRTIADHLDAMAVAVEERTHFPEARGLELESTAILENSRYSEYARNTIARYEELQIFTSKLSLQA